MAFVAILPAGGAILGGLGTMAGAIPLIGGSLSAGLGGLGAAMGAGSLGAAGAALGAIPGGMAAGFGGMGTGLAGLSGGASAMYGGADALLAGMLPNLGMASTVAPSAGWLGGGGLGLLQPMGGEAAATAAMQGPQQLGVGMGAMPGGTTSMAMAAPEIGTGFAGGAMPGGTTSGAMIAPEIGGTTADAFLSGSGADLIAAEPLDWGSRLVAKGTEIGNTIFDTIDPILNPITKVGQGMSAAMPIMDMLGIINMGGTQQAPAMQAQRSGGSPYLQAMSSQQMSQPVNLVAGQQGQQGQMGAMGPQYAPSQYNPIGRNIAQQSNFLS